MLFADMGPPPLIERIHAARIMKLTAHTPLARSWAFTIMTLAASMLPDPGVAVAAVGLAYNVYGILFVTFVAFSMAACVQVGDAPDQ